MNILPNKDIVIIGAGLIGSLLGVTLQKIGFNVSIYERYSDIRSIPSIGRSINLVLTSRGLRAVSLLGKDILEEMIALATPVYGRVVHQAQDRTKEAHFQPYGKDDSEYNLSISRFELNKFLINKAIAAGVKIYFDQRVVACDFEAGRFTVEHVQEKAPQVSTAWTSILCAFFVFVFVSFRFFLYCLASRLF
jgi:kynurenine 3-monooxygenase